MSKHITDSEVSSPGQTSFQIVVIDTETTGYRHFAKPPRRDGVVQVGLAYRPVGSDALTWSEYCNPGETFLRPGWADEALKVNGLTRERILSSLPVATAARHLHDKLEEIHRVANMPVQLRAYNRDFDEPFLAEKPWSLLPEIWGPCIMKDASFCLGGPAAPWVSLKQATRRLAVDWPGGPAHDAAVDAHAALLVLEAILAKPSRRNASQDSARGGGGFQADWKPRAGCQFCASDGPHDGDHGYFRDGDFYTLRW